MHKLSFSLLIPIVALSCHSAKKTASQPPAPTPPPSAVVIKDSSKTEAVKAEPYRASNTRLNDILHTKLEVSFDWTTSRMNGKATIEVRPYFQPTNMLYLNARGMEIKKVEVFEVATVHEKNKSGEKSIDVWNDKLQSNYVYENDSLKINLGHTFTAQQHYYVVIEYIAKPNELKSPGGSAAISDDKGLYFINPLGEGTFKMRQLWTQGETQANSVWMPTIDSPNERMTQDIYMTVDERFTTLSNGSLVESKKNSDGTRTDHWKLELPHAPYLAMMAVGEFKKITDTPWNGKEVSYYVEKDYEPHAQAIFGETKNMIEFFSNRLGVAYPWPKYAQIAVRDYVSGAMENTSATLHGDFMVYQTSRELIDGNRATSVIAHELFHQWFGDLVTCESWSNLPLNESFATYGEYLWEEFKNGRDAADYHHWQSRQGYIGAGKENDLIRFHYKDKEDMFDGISYNKGGQVLHMLRKAVGDDAFFASLKLYLETNKYKSVEIHNLRLAFEETTGRDMNWFFNQWFLNKGRPKIKVTKTYNSSAETLELTLEQVQDGEKAPLVYVLPMEVDIYEGGNKERHHIEVKARKQTFRFKTKGDPQLVNVDAERQLLCDMEYKKTTEEYLHQYRHAPLFADRLEALRELENNLSEPQVYTLFKDAAQNDNFFYLRNYAIGKLEKAPQDKSTELKEVFTSIFTNDKKTQTRARALEALNTKFSGDEAVKALNLKALGEGSHLICAEGLESIAKYDSKLAVEKAKLFENETGKDILFAVAGIYSAHGGDNEVNFFHRGLRYINGFDLVPFCSSYVKTARRSNNATNAIATAMDLEELSKGAIRFVKFTLLKGMKDLAGTWEAKENGLKAAIEADKKDGKDTTEKEKELKAVSETKDILTKMYNRSK